MRCAKSILGLAALGLAPTAVIAQTPSSLIAEEDTIIGMGSMNSTNYAAITDSRLWSALIDTTFSDTTRDGCLLRNGFVMLREGTTLFEPPSSRLGEWVSINMNEVGDLGQILLLETTTGTLQGLYWNLLPIAFKGTAVVSPFVGAGTTWDNFATVKLNNRNTIFALGEVANPAVTGAREDVLMSYHLDSAGNVLSNEVLATKGMFVDALGTVIDSLGFTEHVIAANDNDDFITLVSAVGARVVMINMETVVAQEGQPSSVGTNWGNLTLTKVHINNRGDYIITGSLSTQTYLIEKNGEKFAQAGDVIPSLSAAPLANGTSAPVYISESGDVFWRVAFSAGGEECYARNYEPFIQRNRTTIDGNLVTSVQGDENAFSISPNGRFFVGRVQVQPGRLMVAFVDFGLVAELPACGNAGTLKLDSGRPLVGGQIKLALDNGQVPGALPLLLFSTQRAPGPCGIPTQYGRFLLSPPHLGPVMILPPWNGTGPTIATLNVPNTLALVNAVFFTQGAFRDPAQPSPEKFRFTNALQVELGPP